LTAGEIINKWPESELARIFREYGEERYAKQIAREIVAVRHEKPIHTTFDLLLIIEQVYRNKPKPKIHFATKVFQALRIMVNDELGNIRTVLPLAIEALNAGGRLAVISFHSLEDRIVKDLFREEARGCICPPKLPICNCGHKPRIKILTKKPIIASDEEVRANPRSRSAKMRVVEKI
jgi:16S rRNA (cytosine1402-N4)-methyltransferase